MAAAAYGLSRAQRIRKRADFLRIQDKASRINTAHLVILLSPRAPRVDSVDNRPARLGVVASKKVGPAVLRNRAKRLVRELFRQHAAIFAPGLDVVIVVRPGTPELSLADLMAELNKVSSFLRRRSADLLRTAQERTSNPSER